jgi:hypothetical protein
VTESPSHFRHHHPHHHHHRTRILSSCRWYASLFAGANVSLPLSPPTRTWMSVFAFVTWSLSCPPRPSWNGCVSFSSCCCCDHDDDDGEDDDDDAIALIEPPPPSHRPPTRRLTWQREMSFFGEVTGLRCPFHAPPTLPSSLSQGLWPFLATATVCPPLGRPTGRYFCS